MSERVLPSVISVGLTAPHRDVVFSKQEYSYNEPVKDLPLNIFEVPPPYGKETDF